jgi:hypothetical protein
MLQPVPPGLITPHQEKARRGQKRPEKAWSDHAPPPPSPLGSRPNVFGIFRDMWRKEGPASLMAGAAVRACWLIPYTAIYLPAYDHAKRCLLSAPRPAPPPPVPTAARRG